MTIYKVRLLSASSLFLFLNGRLVLGKGDGGGGSSYVPRNGQEAAEFAQLGLVSLLLLLLLWLCRCCCCWRRWWWGVFKVEREVPFSAAARVRQVLRRSGRVVMRRKLRRGEAE